MEDTLADATQITALPLKKLCARRMAKAHRLLERRDALLTEAKSAAAEIAAHLSTLLGGSFSIEARLLPTVVEPSRSISWSGGFWVVDLAACAQRVAVEFELPFVVSLVERLAGRAGVATPVLELTRVEEAAFGFVALNVLSIAGKFRFFQQFAPRLQSVQTERAAVLHELAKTPHLVIELRMVFAGRSALTRLFVPTSAIETALSGTPESPRSGTLPAVQVSATGRIGRSQLDESALETLSAGDVVMFEGLCARDGKVFGPGALHASSFTLQGSFAPEGFSLTGSLTRRTLEVPMSAPANLPVEVEIELGRFQLPIADLATLREGSVLALHVDARQPVILKVGERAIARAELVELDGEIGARILNLL